MTESDSIGSNRSAYAKIKKTKMESQRIIDLGRKLLALATRGVDGERENAERMLQAFLEKHGLTRAEIEPTVRTLRYVKDVNTNVKQVFINLCANIVGHKVEINKCKGRFYYAVYMNDAEYEVFLERWPVYRKAIALEIKRKKEQQKRELKLVSKAFISKHGLYSEDSEDDDAELKMPTAEELEEIMEMLRMREKMQDINFYKKLNR